MLVYETMAESLSPEKRKEHLETRKVQARRRYKRRREALNAYKKEHPCIRCGEPDYRCLDFHHRDPSQKTFEVSQFVLYGTIERVEKEIAKCDILCANCHRKLHAEEDEALPMERV